MKNTLITAFAVIMSILCISGCKNGSKALLPNVSGKAGEVIVVMDKDNWDGDLGNGVRQSLGGDCPYLAQREPMFALSSVSPTGFADLFKVHRNIFIFNIDPQITEEGVSYHYNVWARPQCIVKLNAFSGESAESLFSDNKERIINAFEQAERDRIVENAKLYEEATLREPVSKVTGGFLHFPTGYKLKMAKDDFVWISEETQYVQQHVYIYKYPAESSDNFSQENIISHRNEIMEANVPGMFDNTYMTTGDFISPTVSFVRYNGLQFAQTRGFWEVHNDFMGGPFVSHAFYSKDGDEIIVLEAAVYAPKYDKRQYLRQVESILYSFEWVASDKKEKAK